MSALSAISPESIQYKFRDCIQNNTFQTVVLKKRLGDYWSEHEAESLDDLPLHAF